MRPLCQCTRKCYYHPPRSTAWLRLGCSIQNSLFTGQGHAHRVSRDTLVFAPCVRGSSPRRMDSQTLDQRSGAQYQLSPICPTSPLARYVAARSSECVWAIEDAVDHAHSIPISPQRAEPAWAPQGPGLEGFCVLPPKLNLQLLQLSGD